MSSTVHDPVSSGAERDAVRIAERVAAAWHGVDHSGRLDVPMSVVAAIATVSATSPDGADLSESLADWITSDVIGFARTVWARFLTGRPDLAAALYPMLAWLYPDPNPDTTSPNTQSPPLGELASHAQTVAIAALEASQLALSGTQQRLETDLLTNPTTRPGLSEQLIDDLVNKLTAFVNYDNTAQKRILADRPEDLTVTLKAFKIRLADALGRARSWDQLADAFTDDEAIPLLTVHRSKGLEYHTVFFVGIDGDQWWAHARNTVESTMTFFVGVSRAAERLIFTQCDQRGAPDRISDLYEVLNQAGVPILRIG